MNRSLVLVLALTIASASAGTLGSSASTVCATNADCAVGKHCYAAGSPHAACVNDGALGAQAAPVAACAANADCVKGKHCYAAGTPHAACVNDGALGATPPCTKDSDCNAEQFCYAQRACVTKGALGVEAPGGDCKADTDCKSDEHCYKPGTSISVCIKTGYVRSPWALPAFRPDPPHDPRPHPPFSPFYS